MRTREASWMAGLIAVAAVVGCGDESEGGEDLGSGASETGGGGAPTGGAVTRTGGGGTTTMGGQLPIGGGGAAATGATGAVVATGGLSATGGTLMTGGALLTGGTLTGGAPVTGGAMSGGALVTGGTAATGGIDETGGFAATGGAVETGGGPATGGAGTGGASDTGGAPTGGVSTGGANTGGTGGTTDPCVVPPEPLPLVGWASVSANGVATTTGGGTATPVTVTSLAELNDAASGTDPAVIYVSGVMEPGTVSIGSNKTVAGLCGAELRGRVRVSGSSNVIVRNLKIVGYNCSDSPSDCSSGADAVGITGGAHHVWFDHCDVSDGSDGNFDINAGSDFVTVSYTKFWYTTARTDPDAGASGHRFSNLIGSGDDVSEDVGHLNVTFHHCWWADNVDQRMPRTRNGEIHVFNNLFTSSGNSYCTNAGFQATLLVENNVYNGVNNPLMEDENATGMLAQGNLFINATGRTAHVTGIGFTPPYSYSLDGTDDLEATLRAEVGPQ